ncbi:MaoC family dehydratase [Thalassobius sp. S69A]|uniref:MaoC family dehydratase n=1 Tax=unclassified Thalassovita TaxID=2619711 RepID=UPI003C7AA42F
MGDIQRGTIYLDEIEMGMMRSVTKEITDKDIEMFAEVSTDHNPVHLDDDYAKGTMFKGRIAHGMLTAGLISAVIGEQLPGHGTIYMGQNLKFMAPVRPGDVVTAEVAVTAIVPEKRRVTLSTRCLVDGKEVLTGEATVLAPAR